ncbi:hypothetical protein HanPSC8_Chr05g0217661 [Helianthus annuus]|nr:hypothetical protein HanPSC8_Chr05g0217661 [Helianthus annuus]
MFIKVIWLILKVNDLRIHELLNVDGQAMKSKGKGVASSAKAAPSRSVRQKRVGTSRVQDGPSGGAQPLQHEHIDVTRRAEWTGGSLLKIHSHWQLNSFNENMVKNSIREAGFQWEKEMTMNQFRLFGIVQKFEALGWEAALSCYDGESERLYLDDVQQWVGTLKLDPGRRPPKTMSLTGRAGGVDVTMSMETLNEIARFDSKPVSQYSYPTEEELKHPQKQSTWDVMLDEIFLEGKGRGADKKKEELRVPARLLLTIVHVTTRDFKAFPFNYHLTIIDLAILFHNLIHVVSSVVF